MNFCTAALSPKPRAIPMQPADQADDDRFNQEL